MAIEVVDHDDAWPGRAEAACAELRDGLPGLFTAIEHMGSTAVRGLPAKPVIDLMAAVVSLDRVTARSETLRLLGYRHHDTGMGGRLFYRRDEGGVRVRRPEERPSGPPRSLVRLHRARAVRGLPSVPVWEE